MVHTADMTPVLWAYREEDSQWSTEATQDESWDFHYCKKERNTASVTRELTQPGEHGQLSWACDN